MFPPPPKKQICASLQQQQQQHQQQKQSPQLQLQSTGTSKIHSIHSTTGESCSKLTNKPPSSGAHSSARSTKSASLSLNISTESTTKSPTKENATSSPTNTVHKSVCSDRFKSEGAKTEPEPTVENRIVQTNNSSKSKTVRNYEPISPQTSSSSDNEDCKENNNDDNNNNNKSNSNRESWSLSSSSSTSSLSSSQSPLTLPTRCDYVNVIVSCKTDGTTVAPAEDAREEEYIVVDKISKSISDNLADDSHTNLVTLSIERIFSDSYLLEAWENLQYIDLFLYSPDKCDNEPHLENFIPGHRILLSAYSDYIRNFVESYPEPVKFVEQLQSFLKDAITQNQTSQIQKSKLDGCLDLKKLSLKALGMSSIPVIVFSMPLDDLHDLVKLMYRGEVKVNKSRINSLEESASKLKMSSITIVEMNKQLITDSSCSFIDNAKHLTKTGDSSFAKKETADTNSNTQNGSFHQKRNFVKQTLHQSCDLGSTISTSQSSKNSSLSQDGGSVSKLEMEIDEHTTLVTPQVILVESTETATGKTIKKESEDVEETKIESSSVKSSSKHPFKRSLATFLRENGTPPPSLSIPKRVPCLFIEDQVDAYDLRSKTFEKPKPSFHASLNEHLAAIAEQQQQNPSLLDVPKLFQNAGKHTFPLYSRSESLNEMDHQSHHHQQLHPRNLLQQHQQTQALRAAMRNVPAPVSQSEPQSPLISSLKRKETPPMPLTPSSSDYSSASSSILSPFYGFPSSTGLLPASLLTPPIDSPSIIESQLKSLLPMSPSTKPFLFPSLPTSLPTPAGLSTPFLSFSAKNPFETGPPVFPTSFAFSKINAGTSGNGNGKQPFSFQRQFSAPANLQSSLFPHQPHDLSPLIFDAQNALNANAVQSELTKNGGRRGRKLMISSYVPSAPNSEPNSPDIGVMMSDLGLFSGGSGSVISGSLSDRSDSPGADSKSGSNGDSHQCGANGWKTTPGSGANCRKRCQNLYHAAKYRDRRRQRMEQLYGEKDALEKVQNGHIAKINSLKLQIVNLINQRTVRQSANGTKTYHCPVCSTIFTSTENIRAHLFSVHYKEIDEQKQSEAGDAAETQKTSTAVGVPSFASIIGNTDPSANIARQICSLTKNWLLKSQVVASLEQLQNSTLQQQQKQQQQQQADQIAKNVSGLAIKSPTPALFERSLSTGSTLNAMPMVPFN